ncbi:MAG: tetratricopeptide repeat protein [Cyanobacteria bacterium SZAS LIN-3]|nr:tetratricopeptide repeat protein [Cyanobacteria bacterium SZAS LIN-3]
MRRVLALLTLAILSGGGAALAQSQERISDPQVYQYLQAGIGFIGQNKYGSAAEQFKLALAKDPHCAPAQVNLGLALIHEGKFEEAQPILLQATKDHPNEPEAWLNLGTSYQSTGKIAESLNCMRQFLKLSPNNVNAPHVRSMITLLEQDQSRRTKMTGNDQGDDYLADAVQSGTIRFLNSRMPLKIYMKPGGDVPGYKPEYDDIVRQAFADWQATAPDLIKFVYVPSPGDADITVAWTNDPSKMISSAEGGHALVVPSNNGIMKSDITLLSRSATTHQPLGPNQVRHLALHEIGHALGIFGHSPRAGDIMYGIVLPTENVSNLSERDKHTMLALYSAQTTAVNSANRLTQGDSNSSLSQIVRLNNEGGDAMKNGNLPLALSKFQEALKIDPSNFAIKQNVAALHSNMASMCYMRRDFAGAESNFRQAIPILEQSPDKTNLKLVLKSYATVLRTQGKNDEAAKVEAKLATVR